MNVARPLVSVAACTLLLIGVDGCAASAPTEPSAGTVEQSKPTRSLDGPLATEIVGGGQRGVYPPKAKRWWLSFGQLEVCTTGAPVTITGIRLSSGTQPLEMKQYVYRAGPNGTGYQGVLGAPPDWEQPYAIYDDPAEDRGTYDDVPGAVVDETCDEVRNGRGPAVVPVMKIGPEGLRSKNFWVDYSADGQQYSLKMPWEFSTCVPTREKCRTGG